ncbi:MAG: heme-binding protein [Haloarculaceae archaeon]
MVRRSTLALGAAGALLAGWLAWGAYARSTTDRVPYATVGQVDGVDLRRYPRTVTAETTAPGEREAFARLYRYLTGANETSEELAMTAPVATRAAIPMTAPVETTDADGDVRMAFYLPEEYDYDSAPRPTDPAVAVVEHPGRTVAVRSFSGYATDGRVERMERALLSTLADAAVEVVGEPFLLRYDAPWTPPFLRTNEVAVEVRRTRSAA